MNKAAGTRLGIPQTLGWARVVIMTILAVAASTAWNAQATPVLVNCTQAQVNTATQNGVAYIDSQQTPNGSYGSAAPISETGLALVAYSVVAGGNFSNLSSSYQLHVQNAITWLLGQQNVAGYWADGGFYQTYSTGLALAGLSSFTSVNPAILAAITNGRAFLVSEFQGPAFTGCASANGSPTSNYCGGWNYDADPGRSDESNTGYALFGLQLTGGVPASLQGDDVNWQHHIQQISTNPFAGRNDGGGSYEPGVNSGNFSSNANDTGSLLFGLAYDGVGGSDPNVMAAVKLAQDILGVYELETAVARNMVFHGGATEDGTCLIGSGGCDWFFAGTGEGGYHYSMFSLTKGLGEFIPPNLGDPTNWYAQVVDLLLSEQGANGSWPQDGRDDASVLFATELSVSALGLVAVPTGPSDVFQVRYAANLNIGDSFVDFTNTGASNGNICANVYTFDPAEELISCCTCSITPNGLQSLSVLKSLISNPLTPAIPSAVVIKVVASTGTCNAATVASGNLAHGLLGWAATLHWNTSTSAPSYSVAETPFSFSNLSPAELTHITSFCSFIQSDGSGFGICRGCAGGGLGASPSVQ